MRLFIALYIGLFLFSCTQNKKATSEVETKQHTESFEWLIGKWNRVNGNGKNETFENWVKESSTKYLGHGFVMSQQDTVWQEKMSLYKNDSDWYLGIKTPGNVDLVSFKIIEFNDLSFSAENPDHDFPKKITYRKETDRLYAFIVGDGKKIIYEFEVVED